MAQYLVSSLALARCVRLSEIATNRPRSYLDSTRRCCSLRKPNLTLIFRLHPKVRSVLMELLKRPTICFSWQAGVKSGMGAAKPRFLA